MITSMTLSLFLIGWLWWGHNALSEPRYLLQLSCQRVVVINGRGYIASRPFASR